MADQKQWRHNELALDLAGHLVRRSGRRAFLDMQFGPAGSPRPDVFTICHSYQHPDPISYECKVTRSDLLRDTGSGKWSKYLKFSVGVVFAIPKGLATKDEIPRAAGLIIRSENAWRMARRPLFNPIRIPQETLLKIAFDSWRYELGREPKPRDASPWRISERVREKLGDEIGNIVADTMAARKRIEDLVSDAERRIETDRRATEIRRDLEAKRRESARDGLSDAQNELSRILGLGGGANLHEIRAAIWGLRGRIDESAEVRHLRKLVEGIGELIVDAVPIGETKESGGD